VCDRFRCSFSGAFLACRGGCCAIGRKRQQAVDQGACEPLKSLSTARRGRQVEVTAVGQHTLVRLREIVAAVWEAEIGDVDPSASFHQDMELDSLQRTEIFARVESEFGVTLDPETVVQLRSLDDIHQLLHDRGALNRIVPGDGQ
jgi:acyl carrier protein